MVVTPWFTSYARAKTYDIKGIQFSVKNFSSNSVHFSASFTISNAPKDIFFWAVLAASQIPPMDSEGVFANQFLSEFDPNDNKTIFSIDLPVTPLKTNNRLVPDDNYTLTMYIGTNYQFTSDLFWFSWAELPTSNYEGIITLKYLGNWTMLQKVLPVPMFATSSKEMGDSWATFNLVIKHPEGWIPIAKTLLYDLPFIFEWPLFGALLIIPCLCILEVIRKRSRENSWVKIMGTTFIPICAAVIVFIPIYWLSILSLTAPLIFSVIDIAPFNLAGRYAWLLISGLVLRLFLKEKHN